LEHGGTNETAGHPKTWKPFSGKFLMGQSGGDTRVASYIRRHESDSIIELAVVYVYIVVRADTGYGHAN